MKMLDLWSVAQPSWGGGIFLLITVLGKINSSSSSSSKSDSRASTGSPHTHSQPFPEPSLLSFSATGCLIVSSISFMSVLSTQDKTEFRKGEASHWPSLPCNGDSLSMGTRAGDSGPLKLRKLTLFHASGFSKALSISVSPSPGGGPYVPTAFSFLPHKDRGRSLPRGSIVQYWMRFLSRVA